MWVKSAQVVFPALSFFVSLSLLPELASAQSQATPPRPVAATINIDQAVADQLKAQVRRELAAIDRLTLATLQGKDDPIREAKEALSSTKKESAHLLTRLIDRNGWPSQLEVGAEAAFHAWWLVTNADEDTVFLQKCLVAMESLPESDISAQWAKVLRGRIVSAGSKVELGQRFSKRRLDSRFWDMSLFEDDLRMRQQHKPQFEPAISQIPSPVAAYKDFYGSLQWPSFEIGAKTIVSSCLLWGRCGVNEDLFSDPNHNLRNYFNLFILTDKTGDGTQALSMVSRNYPHIFSSGKQLTSIGTIDWAHLGLANGDNLAIVSGRVFDLNLGRTILVAPQEDGSVRFMQVNSPDTCRSGTESDLIKKHILELKSNPSVVKFFTNENAI